MKANLDQVRVYRLRENGRKCSQMSRDISQIHDQTSLLVFFSSIVPIDSLQPRGNFHTQRNNQSVIPAKRYGIVTKVLII